jgi:hypothetical protein
MRQLIRQPVLTSTSSSKSSTEAGSEVFTPEFLFLAPVTQIVRLLKRIVADADEVLPDKGYVVMTTLEGHVCASFPIGAPSPLTDIYKHLAETGARDLSRSIARGEKSSRHDSHSGKIVTCSLRIGKHILATTGYPPLWANLFMVAFAVKTFPGRFTKAEIQEIAKACGGKRMLLGLRQLNISLDHL